MPTYYIYIIRCKNNKYYAGFTTDLSKRFSRHTQGHGSKFAKDFSAREKQLKGWSCAKEENNVSEIFRACFAQPLRKEHCQNNGFLNP